MQGYSLVVCKFDYLKEAVMELVDGPAPRRLAGRTSKSSTPRRIGSKTSPRVVEQKKHVTIGPTKHVVIDVPSTSVNEGVTEAGEHPDTSKLDLRDMRRDSLVQVHDDSDVEKAAREGTISGPCDCFLSIWAILGEAIEGGAEQIVGLLLLPITYYYYYYFEADAHADQPGFVRAPAEVDLLDMMASSHPILYLATDLGGLLIISLLVLFEADLHRMYREYKARFRGFQPLQDHHIGTSATESPAIHSSLIRGSKPLKLMRDKTLKRELHRAIDASEELQLRLMVKKMGAPGAKGAPAGPTAEAVASKPAPHGNAQSNDADDEEDPAVAQLRSYQERRAKLQTALSRHYSSKALLPDLDGGSQKAQAAERSSCMGQLMNSTFAKVFKRSANGLITVWLYFADVISDVEVMVLLYSAGLMSYAAIAFALLWLQFVFVWLRVLPYLHMTFGDSTIYRFFLYLGFPFGIIGLDFFMFLEPFGLLPMLRCISSEMRQFVPAYKSTRIIAEVLIESLPQCLLQSYIFVTVVQRVRYGTASAEEHALLGASLEGSTFIHILPRSIAISTVTTLKAWIELVLSAREAGVSVRTRFRQLLHVGFGLPLDALIRGTIVDWSCSYRVADGEVPPLLDALTKNSSLTRLNLAFADLDWAGPDSRPERSAMALVEAMHSDERSLAELKKLIIGKAPNAPAYVIPVARLRHGGGEALAALREGKGLLRLGGPRRVEIMLMADLMRHDRRTTSVRASEVETSASAVMALLESVRAGKVTEAEWAAQVTALMVEGNTRRAHMKTLLSAETLRDVGFAPSALLAIDYDAAELKAGGYSARSLLEDAGFSHSQLHTELGYTPEELRAAGLGASDLGRLGVTALECRGASFSAIELRAAGYPLRHLRSAGYPAEELFGASYGLAALRDVGVTAGELKELVRAKACTTVDLKAAGYSATSLREGGFDVKRLFNAGFDAVECTEAGWTLGELKGAGHDAKALRRAGHSATAMLAVGFEIKTLERAGYSPAELQAAGIAASALKEEGIGLHALKAANTPVADLRAAGYKAYRLKMQGYNAAQLIKGGYTAIELNEGAGFNAKELKEANAPYLAAALGAAGYSPSQLRDGGFTAAEMRAKGYAASDLHSGGYRLDDLFAAGYDPADLKAVGYGPAALSGMGLGAAELLALGFRVTALRKGGIAASDVASAGVTPAQLKQGGYSALDVANAAHLDVGALKELGFGAKAIRATGLFLPRELAAAAFTREELREGGLSRREVEAVTGKGASPAPTVDNLRDKGYSVEELRLIGFGANECRGGGYSCKEAKEGGFGDEALLGAGYRARSVEAVDGRQDGLDGYVEATWIAELREGKGYGAKELMGIGFGLAALVEGGAGAKELRDLGCTCGELKLAGCTAGALREAGFTSKQLHSVGYTLRMLREGGAPWKELVIFLRATHGDLLAAGYRDMDPKDKVFREYRPTSQGQGQSIPERMQQVDEQHGAMIVQKVQRGRSARSMLPPAGKPAGTGGGRLAPRAAGGAAGRPGR